MLFMAPKMVLPAMILHKSLNWEHTKQKTVFLIGGRRGARKTNF